MQKQKKQLLVFVIILLVCVGAYIGVRIYNQKAEAKEQAKEDATKVTVAEIAYDDITSFSYTYEGATLAFTKSGDAWTYDADPTILLDSDVIKTMLSNAETVTAEDKIDSYDSASDYGFDSPSLVLDVATEGKNYTFTFGMKNSLLNQDYMMAEGDDTVYLVATTLQSAFDKTIDDLTAAEDTETEAAEDAITESTEDAYSTQQ